MSPMSDINITGSTNASISMFSIMSWMLGMSDPFNYGLESRMWARSVFYHSLRAIGLFKGVAAVNMIMIPMFMLGLDVVSMRIMDTILKLVMRDNLEMAIQKL